MEKCSLCKVNDANQTGSHIVPHFLMKLIDNVDGKVKRDNELGFVIEPFETHSYFGRGVQPEKLEELFGDLSAVDIELKKNRPFIVDYLFCSQCEKRLSIIESEYSNSLKKISDVKYNSGISSDIGLLFWMSVIWRISINNTSGQRLTKGENEIIRRLLDRSLTDSMKTMDVEKLKNQKDSKKIGYKLIRCPGYTKDSTSVMLFHPEFNKPYTLLLGEYILFFSLKNNFIHYKTRNFFGLKDEIFLASLNQINTVESILPISKDKMRNIHDGIIDKIKEIRLEFIDQFLNTLHVELGGFGNEMPVEIKKEVLEEVTSESKKAGRKYTLQDLRDSTFKVLKKYAP